MEAEEEQERWPFSRIHIYNTVLLFQEDPGKNNVEVLMDNFGM